MNVMLNIHTMFKKVKLLLNEIIIIIEKIGDTEMLFVLPWEICFEICLKSCLKICLVKDLKM